jgi:hypothetical protein
MLVLGIKNTAGDPTCVNGGIYYNSSGNQAKICINSAWTAVGVPKVTSLPATPADGDEVYYEADATNGIYWHFRYNADSASTYKWEFIGGPSIFAEVVTDETTTSTTYADLDTVGPSATVPLAGDYDVAIGYSGKSAANSVLMSYAIGGTAAVDADAARAGEDFSNYISVYRLRRQTGLSGSTALVSKYKVLPTATANIRDRWIEVIPIRVN